MKNIKITAILATTLLLTGCETMDNWMSEPAYRAPEPAMTRPVPRADISSKARAQVVEQSSKVGASTTTTTVIESSPQPQLATKRPVKATTTNGSRQSVVPNVAPSLGE